MLVPGKKIFQKSTLYDLTGLVPNLTLRIPSCTSLIQLALC